MDDDINQNISLHLNRIQIWDLLIYLSDEYDLQLEWRGDILTIKPLLLEPKFEKSSYSISLSIRDQYISVEANSYPINAFTDSLITRTGRNILLDQGISQFVSIKIVDVHIDQAIELIYRYLNLDVRQRDSIIYVSQPEASANQPGSSRKNMYVDFVTQDDVSLELNNSPVKNVVQEIIRQSDIPIINYSEINGNISLKTDHLSLDETLSILLKSTTSTFRKEEEVYYIGNKDIKGMATRELVKLKHIKSSGVLELFPQALLRELEIKEIKELNSLMLIGTRDMVEEAKSFLNDIDLQSPQILIEALVVDYQLSKLKDFELKVGSDPSIADNEIMEYFPTLNARINKGGISAEANADIMPDVFSRNVGYLPQDFYIQLNAMEQDGYVKIQSKPHIATLNGHEASLVISDTQYYIFESETAIPTTGNWVNQKTQRFEKVEAMVKLEITPWVSADGEITVEIKPEFSTPVGSFDPEIPPRINSRTLNSTVRLKDGETIILGGLIQTTEGDTKTKFPILGSLPWIGRFFQGRNIDNNKSELVIYLTPYLNMPPVEVEDLEFNESND